MKIGFTIGDINGIGVEVLVKTLLGINDENLFTPVVYSNVNLLTEYLYKIDYSSAKIVDNYLQVGKFNCELININSELSSVNFGEVTSGSGKHAGDSIKSATFDCLNNILDSIVTLPISKEALNFGGYNFPGHTEMISHYVNGSPLMILMVDKVDNNSLKRMKVALVTTHIPLNKVSEEIFKRIEEKIRILYNSLIQDFGIVSPRISVLGLNPHSGENGSIGNEELQIINPIINKLKSEGKLIEGPFPADGFFARYNPLNQDAILAMYHDQGLIPLKMYSGHTGVNFTAGLPIVRTSPDHGTAFNIAGENLADPQSTIEAVLSSIQIIKNRKLFSERNYKQSSL